MNIIKKLKEKAYNHNLETVKKSTMSLDSIILNEFNICNF